MSTGTRRGLLLGGAGVLAAPAVLRADTPLHWRMVTSWPRNLPGPGMNAQRLADRIGRLSGGRLAIQLYAAGELVPALQVFDAVNSGAAEMGHSRLVLLGRQGQGRAVLHHRAVRPGPDRACGLDRAWRRPGPMGRAVRAVRPQAVHGRQFRRADGRLVPARDHRAGGFARAEAAQRRPRRRSCSSAWVRSTVALGVPDIYPALQSGTIDAVEFLGPASDLAAGFYQTAKLYYWPTFTKPNGTAECLVGATGLGGSAGRPAGGRGRRLCCGERLHPGRGRLPATAQALAALVGEHGVSLRRWPDAGRGRCPAGSRGPAGRLRHRWRHRPARPGILPRRPCIASSHGRGCRSKPICGARAGD